MAAQLRGKDVFPRLSIPWFAGPRQVKATASISTAIFDWTHFGGRYACFPCLMVASKQINMSLKIAGFASAVGRRGGYPFGTGVLS